MSLPSSELLRTTCPGVDTVKKQDVRCSKPINLAEDHKWCSRHFEAQKTHYETYKKLSDEFDNFDDSTICTDPATIKSCKKAQTLQSWATKLREKFVLCGRVIQRREYHHRRFYDGGDPAHIHWISCLWDKQAQIEAALLAVNQRHDELSDTKYPEVEDLDDEEVEAVLYWPSSSSDSDDSSLSTDPYADPDEVRQQRERGRLIERLFAFRKTALLHGADTREAYLDYMERLVILAMRDRSGMRPLLRAETDDLEEFLTQDIITMDELRHIYVAVHVMPPRRVLSAITDAFRSEEDVHERILGRRIFNEEWAGEINLDAWDLFEDVMPCRHCALQGCDRLEEWAKVDRLATLSLRFLRWHPENGSCDGFSGADMLFHLNEIYAARTWERHAPPARYSQKDGLYVQDERPAALYLQFPVANADLYHRFLAGITSLPHVFSVLPWAPDFRDASRAAAGTLIPKAPTKLSVGRRRTALRLDDVPDSPWLPNDAMDTAQARRLLKLDTWKDPNVLHMLVADRAGTGVGVARLKDNLAQVLLYVQQQDQPEEERTRTADEYIAAELREALDAGTSDFGARGQGESGLLAIACAAVGVSGECFKAFSERCVNAVEGLKDSDMVSRWVEERRRKQKRKDGVKCWTRWRRKLDRMHCSQDFFYFGTEEGRTHLRKILERTISPMEGAMVKYDEDVSQAVFERALHQSTAVENMLPPRKIKMDWDGELFYPDEFKTDFNFMGEDVSEATRATIVELYNELPARIEYVGI